MGEIPSVAPFCFVGDRKSIVHDGAIFPVKIHDVLRAESFGDHIHRELPWIFAHRMAE